MVTYRRMPVRASESSVTGATKAATSGEAMISMTVAWAASPTRTTVRGNTAAPSASIQWTTTNGFSNALPAGTSINSGDGASAVFNAAKASGWWATESTASQLVMFSDTTTWPFLVTASPA